MRERELVGWVERLFEGESPEQYEKRRAEPRFEATATFSADFDMPFGGNGVPYEASDRRSWAKRAACNGMDTNVFFPVVKGRACWDRKHPVVKQALDVCAGCEVRQECLHEVMVHERPDPVRRAHGVRGGLTPPERVKMVRSGRLPRED